MSREKRVDYKLLNSTGEVVVKKIPNKEDQNLSSQLEDQLGNLSINDMSTSQLNIDLRVIISDINDAIDENPTSECSESEITSVISKLEDYRTILRRKNMEMQATTKCHDDSLQDTINEALAGIKDYIKSAKDFRSKCRLRGEVKLNEEAVSKNRSIIFSIEYTQHWMDELEKEFIKEVNDVDRDQLLEWRTKISSYNTKMEKIAESYKEILKTPINNADILMDIKRIGENYVKLETLKQKFQDKLHKEISVRELDKDVKFNKHQLNIQLEKFTGYDASSDVYTFRSNFEKIHLDSTPKRLLPDLLKNNYLDEPAKNLVTSLDNIDEIWDRLQSAYGDTNIMIRKKLQSLLKIDLTRTRDNERTLTGLSKLTNALHDIIKLAKTHNIEERLYFGDGLTKVYQLIGDNRVTRFLSSIYEDNLNEKQTWQRLLLFLEKETKLVQQKIMINDTARKENHDNSKTNKGMRSFYSPTQSSESVVCFICGVSAGVDDHVATLGPGGSTIVQYFTCRTFAEWTPAKRLSTLKEKGYCFQCLLPGADSSQGKHQEGRCQHEYVCTHSSHQRYTSRKHVLVCDDHKEMDENKKLLEKYRQKCILRNNRLPSFAKTISLSFYTKECFKVNKDESLSSRDSVSDRGIYLLQTVNINGRHLTIFYDSGCSDFVLTDKAVEMLGSNAIKESSKPTILGGVGNTITKALGSYCVKLVLYNNEPAYLSGICLKQITSEFPLYPLDIVEKDIQDSYAVSGGQQQLPKLSSKVGGEVHLMIGIKYLRYHPKMIFQLPSGLAIYESKFVNADGGRGVIGGPHQIFTQIHQHFFNKTDVSTFLSNQYQLFRYGVQVNVDVPLLGFQAKSPHINCSTDAYLSSRQRIFEEVETVGSEITFRCPSCRTCKTCKHHQDTEVISIREEVEQSIIASSVNVDCSNRIITAKLPFIADPYIRLAPNKDVAMKIFRQQLRKLNDVESESDKKDIIASEKKLHNLGYVDFVHNLPANIQSALSNHVIQNFIPWRAVWKSNSISTPCRIVFDASQVTSSGYSLNDVLAKGKNNLNKLQEILIRWSIHKVALHTDVNKMYNTVRLDESDWCFQRYIWQNELDPSKMPEEKVIKTLIYGVKSSGNQAEYGLRKIAELSKEEYPKVNFMVQNDIYVDDCISGENSYTEAHKQADHLEIVLNRGGFNLKGVTFSGEDPPTSLTNDGTVILVGGMKWFPKEDTICLNIEDLNFSKKRRGKKSVDQVNIIPQKLTRRHCSSKVAEVFDITGKVSALVASMKLDLQELLHRNLDWDDAIPEDLRPIWENNFQMMKEIGTLRFKRAIIPDDAVDLNVNTLDFGDASQKLVCICIYARFLRRNGMYSCQLLFSRTRVVPKNMSMPRAELYAALINAHTGEIVKRSLKDWYKSSIKFTDSQIALHWISNDEKPLKQWVRNRVLEILRFTAKQQWHYISSKLMIADIGTRKGVTVQDVNQSSVWINGYQWMQNDSSTFKMSTVDELKLNEDQLSEACKERSIQVYQTSIVSSAVKERYEFSNYLVDPNSRDFSSVVRVMAYVNRFCNILIGKIRERSNSPKLDNSTPSEEEIKCAERYFFRKGSDEIRKFVSPSKYTKITTTKDGLLIYTGRILPNSKVSIVGKFTNAMTDLCSTSFCVPVLDRHSPLAYSIVSDVHWNSRISKHAGIETTHRLVLQIAFIIEGRQLVKLIKKNCQRCRYLEKRTVEMAMGPVSTYNLTIAPAFYYSQLDLSGPYLSYSPQHKRTTIKVWLIVFCCCSTSAVDIKVMDDYSTSSFVQAFTRFACKHGFPRKLLSDEGSQLIKGCKEMKLNYVDIKAKIMTNASVEFEVCPVQGHNMHGKVERKIKEINSSIKKSVHNQRLSILEWETLSSIIANQINNLPLALGNVSSDFECLDLITPNRLLLGRNNDRSPDGFLIQCNNPSKTLRENERVYNAWFEVWLLVHVPKLMKQQKWYDSDSINVGDIILFTKQDSKISNTYTYGMIVDLECSDDGLPRKAKVRYRNFGENVFRETFRSVRGLVIIHGIHESDIMTELGELAMNIDLKSSK